MCFFLWCWCLFFQLHRAYYKVGWKIYKLRCEFYKNGKESTMIAFTILFILLSVTLKNSPYYKCFFPFGNGVSADSEMVCQLTIVQMVFFLIIQDFKNIGFAVRTKLLVLRWVCTEDFFIEYDDIRSWQICFLDYLAAHFYFFREISW